MEKALIRVKDLCKIYNPGENEVRALKSAFTMLPSLIPAPNRAACSFMSIIICVPSTLIFASVVMVAVGLKGPGGMLTCSLQNGIILLVMAFLISPYGLPMAAIWLLGKVQDLKFAIQDLVYG